MAVQLRRVREFTPEKINAGRPDSEKVKVHLRSVDVQTKQSQLLKFANKKSDELMAEMNSPEGSKEIKDILTKCVVKIEGIEYVDEVQDGEEETTRPATIADLWSEGELQLCLEIFMDILSSSQLSKAEAKNSLSQSGSPRTPEVSVH